MGLGLLDSGVIVGFLDADDAFHRSSRAAIASARGVGHGFIASAVTYTEMLTGVALGHHDPAIVRGFFRDVIAEIIPVDVDVAERAAQLRGSHKSLKTPDALTLATGELYADLVLISDDQWQRIEGVWVELVTVLVDEPADEPAM